MKARWGFVGLLVAVSIVSTPVVAAQEPPPALPPPAPGAWLDAPLQRWNAPGMAIPRVATTPLSPPECASRHRAPGSPEEAEVVAAGWQTVEYWPSQSVGGLSVVMAVSDHDGMCRPLAYNAFVFTDGRFAGTVSPVAMSSRSDGHLSRVPAVLPGGRVQASFIRFAPGDPLCCPSRPPSMLGYQVEHTIGGPVLIAHRPGAGGPRPGLPATGDGTGDGNAGSDGDMTSMDAT